MLGTCKESDYLIGVDVGGTKVEVALLQKTASGELKIQDQSQLEHRFTVVGKKRTSTERELGYKNIVKKISTLINENINENQTSTEQIISVGFGLPGSLNPRTKKMTNGNTRVLIGQDLAADVKKEMNWQQPFLSENDANCFALAEALCGAGNVYHQEEGVGHEQAIAIGIILGTGCGGGIVINGKVLSGKDGGAGEIGHMVFEPNGLPCYCGRQGCPEQYLSGPGLEAMFAQRRYSQIQDVVSSQEIFQKATENEPVAVAVLHQYRQYLGKFLGSLSSVFNPDYFVLGGGVSSQSLIYEGLNEILEQNTYTASNKVKIYQSQLGDSSGVLGAAFLPFVS